MIIVIKKLKTRKRIFRPGTYLLLFSYNKPRNEVSAGSSYSIAIAKSLAWLKAALDT